MYNFFITFILVTNQFFSQLFKGSFMPIHASQVFTNAKNLIDKAIIKGENFQTIAIITKVHDSTVRNWYRRNRAKLSVIQPLIDHLQNKDESPKSIKRETVIFDDLVIQLKRQLKTKIENYLAGHSDTPPLADAQLIKLIDNNFS